MNISSIFGLSIIGSVLYFGVLRSAHTPMIFLDAHAIILVLGGTIGTALIGYPISKLLALIDFILFGVIFKKKHSSVQIVNDLVSISLSPDCSFMDEKWRKTHHPFLVESTRLMKQSTLNLEQKALVLHSRKEAFRKQYELEAKMLVAISKFPPALGLLGASTGMIEMMSGLSDGGTAKMGAAMAVALVATFWGIALANLILLPLADYANRITTEDVHQRELIIEGLLLIHEGFTPYNLAHHLSSKLPIKERIQTNIPKDPNSATDRGLGETNPTINIRSTVPTKGHSHAA